ncbi:Tkl protein kinase, partial [Globisporangium splendens]
MRGYALAAASIALVSLGGIPTTTSGAQMVAASAQVAEATCTVPAKTLTFECDNLCDEFQPCWMNSSAKSTTSCPYECYNIYDSTYNPSTFVFLVPYGKWTSAQEQAGVTPKVAAQGATMDTANYISKSNDLLETIDTLELPAKATAVSIVGGSYYGSNSVKGHASNVAFATDLMTKETQAMQIYFANLNLQPQVDKLAGMFPSTASSIALTNGLLTTFPSGFSKFAALTNLISEILEAHAVESVQTFNLGENPFTNVSITNAQASFLVTLDNFTFPEDSLNKDCYVYQQREVHGLKFCISDATFGVNTSSGSSSSPIGVIVGVAGAVVVLIAAIGFFFWYCARKSRYITKSSHAAQSDSATSNMSKSNGTSAASLWNDAELLSVKVNAAEIQDIKQIGKGAYGDVWLVKYGNNQLVASKRIRKKELSHERSQDFISEIKLVAKLEHPKIVRFIGAAWTIEADLQALFEYMEGGDLRTYLENPRTSRSWTHEKLQIAIDVIEALVYVHSFAPPLVHRDLKSRNILLTADLEAKLTDFGASRYRSDSNTMTAGVGTGKWLAPEVIAGSTDYGPAADIFSFGAVLSELDTHALPYDNARGANGNKLVEVALLQLISTGELTPSFGAYCPDRIAELANRCFAFQPADRPTAAEVAYALRNIKKNMYTIV